MPKYIQVDIGVNLENNHLHTNNIDIANDIVSQLSSRLGKFPVSLIYNSSNSRTRIHRDFVEDVPLAEFISNNVNYYLDLYDEHNDHFICLPLYFNYILSSKQNISKDKFKLLFKDLYLPSIFGELSANLLKDKLNLEMA